MPLAYYAVAATREFWTEHWGAHSIVELLENASRSPLTRLVLDALPSQGRVLEAGCGPGHYVILLRRAGRPTFGVDFSWEALRQCRAEDPGAPVSAMDLRALGFATASFACYISLGVVEHDSEGPDAILAEAWRVLEPGGVLILSVPYVNGVRHIGTYWIRRRNRRIREAGGAFYQFAFSRTEVREFLERKGFRVLGATPYDPARVLRRAWRNVRQRFPTGGKSRLGLAPAVGGGLSGMTPESLPLRSHTWRVLRRLLYTRPCLRALGHMILVVALKPSHQAMR